MLSAYVVGSFFLIAKPFCEEEVYTTKGKQTMNLALKLRFNQQQQSVFRPHRLVEDSISCSYICKYTTLTNRLYVPENDCTETEQSFMNYDKTIFVKGTLIVVKTQLMYHLTTVVYT